MPLRRDNQDERLARIEALMEEYRVNHEDLEAYVQKVRTETKERHRRSKQSIVEARETLRLARLGKHR